MRYVPKGLLKPSRTRINRFPTSIGNVNGDEWRAISAILTKNVPRSVGGDDINWCTIPTSKSETFVQKCRICSFDPLLEASGQWLSRARRISFVRHFWDHLLAFIWELQKNHHYRMVRSPDSDYVHLWSDLSKKIFRSVSQIKNPEPSVFSYRPTLAGNRSLEVHFCSLRFL